MGAALRGLGIEASYYAPPSEEETAAATSDDRVARAIAAAGNTLWCDESSLCTFNTYI
jgi:hypothetical protein